MKSNFENVLHLAGRLLIAALFFPAGLAKLTGFAGTVGYIASVGLPLATIGAIVAIVIEVGGGIALVIGFQTRVVAIVLALFTLVASVIFHPYWAVPADQAFVTQLLFFKNIAVIGGLLILASAPHSRFSLGSKNSQA